MTMERAYPAIRGVYALVGSTDRVGAEVFDFPHNYNQTSRNAVYASMGRWLLGIDDAEKTREGHAAAREARGPAHVRLRPPGPDRPEDARAARRRPDRDPPASSSRSIGPAAGPSAMGGRRAACC